MLYFIIACCRLSLLMLAARLLARDYEWCWGDGGLPAV